MPARIPHVIAFDDAPFAPEHRGGVLVVGAVCAGTRLAGVLSGRVRRDGADATRVLARLVCACRYRPQLHAILLQGIALAGFNVVDLPALCAATGLPVMAVTRRRPDETAVREALLGSVQGGALKWRRVRAAGRAEPAAGLHVQRAGISLEDAAALIAKLAVDGRLPEPLRIAHLVAGGIATGESRHRP